MRIYFSKSMIYDIGHDYPVSVDKHEGLGGGGGSGIHYSLKI